MPLESVEFVIVIGTHTDSLPLHGPKLCEALQRAIAAYAREAHTDVEIVELEAVRDGERVVWRDDAGRVEPHAFRPDHNGECLICDELADAHPADAPDLYAWIGEDELGSGEVGLKQGVVPAGYIPLVAVKREKMDQAYIVAQLQAQARRYGKTIRLVRYVAQEEVVSLKP